MNPEEVVRALAETLAIGLSEETIRPMMPQIIKLLEEVGWNEKPIEDLRERCVAMARILREMLRMPDRRER